MERASKVIGKLNLPEGTISSETLACVAWAGAVGPRIAAHARAVRLVRSRLVVEVEDNIWQRQLYSLREQIRRRMEESIGPGIVDEFEFRVIPLRLQPSRAATASGTPTDEAQAIADPVLRTIYRASRKRRMA